MRPRRRPTFMGTRACTATPATTAHRAAVPAPDPERLRAAPTAHYRCVGPFRVACPDVRHAAVGAPVPRSEDDPPALVQERPRPGRLRIERVRRMAGPQLERRD